MQILETQTQRCKISWECQKQWGAVEREIWGVGGCWPCCPPPPPPEDVLSLSRHYGSIETNPESRVSGESCRRGGWECIFKEVNVCCSWKVAGFPGHIQSAGNLVCISITREIIFWATPPKARGVADSLSAQEALVGSMSTLCAPEREGSGEAYPPPSEQCLFPALSSKRRHIFLRFVACSKVQLRGEWRCACVCHEIK